MSRRVPIGTSARARAPVEVLILLALGAVPLLSLVGHPGAVLADPSSEYPVKLWLYETLPAVGLFGGPVPIGFPHVGPLNNGDLVGTIVTGLLRPLLGRAGAFDAFIVLELQATLLATWLLARDLVEDPRAALVSAVGFALTPLVLTYCVAGAVTEMLNLWPYPLAFRAFLRGGLGNGARAGAWAAVGVGTCPYDAVVFAAMAVPAVLFVPSWGRGVGRGRGTLPATLLGVVLTAAPLGGAYAWNLARVTGDADAQVSAAGIARTRHEAPWPDLRPEKPDRYTAFLSDYVAVGKGSVISREAGSRYLRAFSPGFTLLGLAALGLVRAPRRAGLWAAMGAWSALASLGPFLPLTSGLSSPTAINLVWLGLDRLLPGAHLLLEPFRYALGATLGLALCAGFGLEVLCRRWGARAAGFAVAAWLGELVVLSPVPVPLPTALPTIPPAYAMLDTLPPGALVELPYFDRGTRRFVRAHFLHQLVHRRPIADEVMGFVPRAFRENAFLGLLLQEEVPLGPIQVSPADLLHVDADRARLAADGWAAIVVDPSAFSAPERRDAVLARLATLGPPRTIGDRTVYTLR